MNSVLIEKENKGALADVYVVDDDVAVLKSVEAVLAELNLRIRSFSSVEAFMQSATTEYPGCVVTDFQMPGLTGLDLQEKLNLMHSPLSVIVVSGVVDVQTTVVLMRNGAVTLLEKPYEPEVLVSSVQKALKASLRRWKDEREKRATIARLSLLTTEERQILDAMLLNKTNKAIALQLDLSMRTMDRRRNNILHKMEVSSIPELAIRLARVDEQHCAIRDLEIFKK